MQKQGLWRYSLLVLLTLSIAINSASPVGAVTATSPNYQVTETQFGSSQKSCSGQYCAQTTIGDVTDGGAAANSTANFEDITNNEPFLDMIVEAGDSNLGVLTTQHTATKLTTIKIRSYLIAGGYTLQIIGDPPKFENHHLATSATPEFATPGTEMFGINVVANTSPSVGANPVQVPADQQNFGVVDDNYKTPNKFMYQSEAIVARGETDSGRTDYTVSMVVNISSSTPAGKYTGDFVAFVVPAY